MDSLANRNSDQAQTLDLWGCMYNLFQYNDQQQQFDYMHLTADKYYKRSLGYA